MEKSLGIIFAIILVDMIGFGIIIPLIPYYAEDLGASAIVVGLLVASFSLAQMIGAPILGKFSDKYGRRPALIITSIGTFVGYLIFGISNSLGVLFLARIITGLTGGNISVAQAYISDVTDARSRAKGMGLVGAAFGLGLIIGPALGGTLSMYGLNAPAFFSAGLSFIFLIAVILLLPESLSKQKRIEIGKMPKKRLTLIDGLKMPRFGTLIQFRFFFGVAFTMFTSIFALYAQSQLQLSPDLTGYVLAYMGLLIVLVQGLGISKISARFSDDVLIFAATIGMVFSLISWAFSNTLLTLLIILLPMSISAGIFNTIINSAVTKAVLPTDIGSAMGLSTSVDSATRVIAPTLGGYLIGNTGAFAPGLIGAALTGYLVIFGLKKLKLH